jgi:hypothetical protein
MYVHSVKKKINVQINDKLVQIVTLQHFIYNAAPILNPT